VELAVDPQLAESLETRIVRYLTWAGEALKSAGQARSHDLRDAYLGIANSWMRLAEDAMRRIGRS
jgi:hypothetical protein